MGKDVGETTSAGFGPAAHATITVTSNIGATSTAAVNPMVMVSDAAVRNAWKTIFIVVPLRTSFR